MSHVDPAQSLGARPMSEVVDSGFDVAAVREQFPNLHRQVHGRPLVYLDSAASAHKPVAVLEALEQLYTETYSNVHRGVHHLSQEATEAYEAARRSAVRFVGAASEREVVFTSGTTDAINLVAHSFGQSMQPGDEVVITEIEHHSNIVPWQLLAQRSGVRLRVAPVQDDGSLDLVAFEALLTPATRLVSVAHVSNALGTIHPVNGIAELAHGVGAKVLLDGAQGAVHLPVDVTSLDCDFYAFSGHKVYGPTGIGVLWGREALLEAMPPYRGGGEMIATVSFEGSTWADLPAKFEAGTPHIAGAVGLGAALDWLDALGRPAVAAYETELLAYGTELLAAVPGLRMIGTASQKAGVLSFVVDGVHSQDLGTLLDEQGIAVRTGHHCAEPAMARFRVTGTVRASLAVYTTRGELETLARAVHTAVRMLS